MSTVQELGELVSLREGGVLTDAEFEDQKKLLLAKYHSLEDVNKRIQKIEESCEKLSLTINVAIDLLSMGDIDALLQRITKEMDILADGVYGTGAPPRINKNFIPDAAQIDRFVVLDDIACRLVATAGLPIDIPSHAGIYLFYPPGHGISGDFTPVPSDSYLPMRLRCDHHLIKKYINGEGGRP